MKIMFVLTSTLGYLSNSEAASDEKALTQAKVKEYSTVLHLQEGASTADIENNYKALLNRLHTARAGLLEHLQQTGSTRTSFKPASTPTIEKKQSIDELITQFFRHTSDIAKLEYEKQRIGQTLGLVYEDSYVPVFEYAVKHIYDTNAAGDVARRIRKIMTDAAKAKNASTDSSIQYMGLRGFSKKMPSEVREFVSWWKMGKDTPPTKDEMEEYRRGH